MTKKPETVNQEDLIRRKDNLMYKKYARVPFTGISERFWENGQLKGKILKGSDLSASYGYQIYISR